MPMPEIITEIMPKIMPGIIHFLDEKFWLAVSFVIFLYFAYKPIKKALLNSLDLKIASIKEQVLEAQKLNIDAQDLLKKTTEQLEKLANLGDKIIKEGVEATDRLVVEKNKEIEMFLERKQAEVVNLIENQQSKALQVLQTELSDKITKLVTLYFQSSQNAGLKDSEIAKKFMGK